ncbi:hypothetical protein BGZ52_005149 [Haplosporangium bisporale]|nr:hypothetical protein BGZ52_005149 [Haplosporangium bisporale]
MLLSPVSHYSYDQFLELTGKYALVTGANIGIGYATTLALVTHGAQWPAEVKGARLQLDFLEMDLNDLKKVQRAAQEYLSRGHPLHILINNGGISSEEWSVSADGTERHFALNYLGHFVLTTALLDRLKESQPSRVVVVSSLAYEILPPGGFDLSIINDETVGYKLSNQTLNTKYASDKIGGVRVRSSTACVKKPARVMWNINSANLVSILPKMIKSINIILLDALHYEKMKYVLYSIHHDGKLVGAYGYKVDGFPPLQYCDLE